MNLASLYFSPNGRIPRKVYWLASLPLIALWILSDLRMRGAASTDDVVPWAALLLALVVPSLVLGIKRCHDRNKTGWFVLVSLIPVLGPLWLLVELGFLRGTEGRNAYGSDPLIPTPDHHSLFAETP